MALVQGLIVPHFKFFDIHPDLIVLVILSWSLGSDADEVLPWAFLGGVILDLLVSTPFGIFTLSMLVMALSANIWHGKSFGHPVFMHAILALPYTTLFNLTAIALLQVFVYPIAWGDALGKLIFPSALINMGTMIIVAPSVLGILRLKRGNELTIPTVF